MAGDDVLEILEERFERWNFVTLRCTDSLLNPRSAYSALKQSFDEFAAA